ncbi:uncharacterized protein [Cherax quadricarinatus]|uniref:uncharacterized protein isoform X2 n=1 Tax=Cherax quadricarinatus TaxID=27406 RepID=UPI00387EA3F6
MGLEDEKDATDMEEGLNVHLYSQDESEDDLQVSFESNFRRKKNFTSKLYLTKEKKHEGYKTNCDAEGMLNQPSMGGSSSNIPFNYLSAFNSVQHTRLHFQDNFSYPAFCNIPCETLKVFPVIKNGGSSKMSDSKDGKCDVDTKVNIENVTSLRLQPTPNEFDTENQTLKDIDDKENNSSSNLMIDVIGKINTQNSDMQKKGTVEYSIRGGHPGTSEVWNNHQHYTKKDSSDARSIPVMCRNYQAKENSFHKCELKNICQYASLEKSSDMNEMAKCTSPSEILVASRKKKGKYLTKVLKISKSFKSLASKYDSPPKVTPPEEISLNSTFTGKENSERCLEETSYQFSTPQESQVTCISEDASSGYLESGSVQAKSIVEPKSSGAHCHISYSYLGNESFHGQDVESLPAYTANEISTNWWLFHAPSSSSAVPQALSAHGQGYNYAVKSECDEKELQMKKFKPGFIDTHCHLDFLFQRLNFSGSYAEFQSDRENKDPFPVSYEGCVAIFCKPWTFKKINWWEDIISTSNVWAAFGCHPHFSESFSDEEEVYLRHALQNEKTVALGEIGLDYSERKYLSRELQQAVFRKQLQIALEYKKPIVIHCRDAHRDCIEILKEIVPRDYLIHRHCFTDKWEDAKEWLETFSKLYLGFTNLITYAGCRRSCNIRETVRRMPLNRLLLETDAPYFRPLCYSDSGRFSHPGMAIHVAAQVAKLRNEEIQVVLNQARKNTRDVYGI